MSELKSKRTTRASNRNQEPEIVQPQRRQPQPERQPQQPRNNAKKRAPQQRSLFGMGYLRKEVEPVQEPKQILSSIKQLLKTTSIESIMQHCPMMQSFLKKLCEKPFVDGKMVMRCLDKYFHGNTTSLWEVKYAPKDLEDIFQVDFADKVHEWIKDFYYFRKRNEELDFGFDFIDDDGPDSCSKSLEARMRQYGWNCRALVLKGRTGVGKSSLLTSIAKSMQIKCFEFSSAFDQLQKMKQLEDGSRSEVVTNMNVNKKKEIQDNKIIMGNQSIACYMPGMKNQKDTTLQTRQPKRMQIFRDFSQYYPPFEKSDKQGIQQTYFRYLFDKIQKSTFPYALTSTKFDFSFKEKNLCTKFSNYDEIQFIEPSVEDLTNFFWLILQIETHINLQLNKKVRKADIFAQLNEQFSTINLNEDLDDPGFIEKIVRKANKKLHYIFKYLQFRVLPYKNLKKNSDSFRIEEQKQQEARKVIKKSQQQSHHFQLQISQNQFNKSNSQSSLKNQQKLNSQYKSTLHDKIIKEKQQFQDQILLQIGFDILDNINPENLVNDIEWSLFSQENIDNFSQTPKVIDLEEEGFQQKSKCVPFYRVINKVNVITPLKNSEQMSQVEEKKKLEETHEKSAGRGREQLMSDESQQQKPKQEQRLVQTQEQKLIQTNAKKPHNNQKIRDIRNMFKLSKICNKKIETQLEGQEQVQQKKLMRQVRDKLAMETLQDRLIFHNEYYHHFNHKIPHENNQIMRVKTETHARAKRNILRKMKKMYIATPFFTDASTSYKNSMLTLLNRVCRRSWELFYLPLGFPGGYSTRRTSRSRLVREVRLDENLAKILTERRELEYLLKFSKFVGTCRQINE